MTVEERIQRQENWNQARRERVVRDCTRSGSAGFLNFIKNFGTVFDAPSLQMVPFDLWPVQKEGIQHMFRFLLFVNLKCRQAGWSWILAHLALWYALFHFNTKVGLVSFNEKEAKLLMEKVYTIFNWMPSWIKPEVGKDSEAVLQFAKKTKVDGRTIFTGMNSMIEAHASTGNFLRGVTPALGIFDEFPQIAGIDKMMGSFWGSRAQSRARMVFNGTGGDDLVGPGISHFQEMYEQAGLKDCRWERMGKFFTGWRDIPTYDEEWESEFRQLLGPKFRFEFPETAEEAFATSTDCYYDPDTLDNAIKALLAKPKPMKRYELTYNEKPNPGQIMFDLSEDDDGWLHMWVPPNKEHSYCMGVDPSWGMKRGDKGAAYVMDDQTGEFVACMKGHYAQEVMAEKLYALGHYYNIAFIMTEVNQGLMLTKILTNDLGYPNIYFREPIDDMMPKMTSKMGFFMGTNKTDVYDEFEIYWRTGKIKIYDLELFYEMKNIRNLKTSQDSRYRRVGTHGKRPDDLNDAAVVTLQAHRVRPALASSMDAMQEHLRDAKAHQQIDKLLAEGKIGVMINPELYDLEEMAEVFLPNDFNPVIYG
ncbi:MAG: hypothetical protein ABIE47_01600 [Pseudomonadota bacterium]